MSKIMKHLEHFSKYIFSLKRSVLTQYNIFYQKQNYLLVDGVFVRDMGASIYKMLQVK